MTSKTFLILSKQLDPLSVIEKLLEELVQAERCYPIDPELVHIFNHNTNCSGRKWGENSTSIGEIETIEADDGPGFLVRCNYEVYGGGAWHGTEHWSTFIPDKLVQLYETWAEGSEDDQTFMDHFDALQVEVENFTKTRVAELEKDLALHKQQAEEAAALLEATERAKLAELKAKYG